MSAKIELVLKIPKEFEKRDTFFNLFAKRALSKMALVAIANIKTRTARGIDFQGQGFRPYTEEYAALRNQFGRNTAPVDLTWTGRMLGNLKITRTEMERAKIYIGFSGTHQVNSIVVDKKSRKFKTKRTGREIPIAGMVAGLNRKRRFFALGPKDKQDIRRVAEGELNKMIREINARNK
jgi:hypothetical protein